MSILVTGGAGFIGSHTCLRLLEDGHQIVVVDNFSNSQIESVRRVKQISGIDYALIQGDIRDEALMRSVFQQYNITAVIHFAGLNAVGESNEHPLKYYDNNVLGTVMLLQIMAEFAVKTIVFSSSATVYGDPASLPIKEGFALSATNPYGRSKLMIEDILRDLHQSDTEWRIAILRYFNPIGAHVSGLIGENPNGIPNNLLPYVTKVAIGHLPALRIFGNDYPTQDGTGVRDYIHVMDLADGHLQALNYLFKHQGLVAVNLGTGKGYSVLEVVDTFSKVANKNIPFEFWPRRQGDVAVNYADPQLAKDLFGWVAQRDLLQMCQDAWRWQSKNPNGFSI
jgi:UDP-glucose 4-epimerase